MDARENLNMNQTYGVLCKDSVRRLFQSVVQSETVRPLYAPPQSPSDGGVPKEFPESAPFLRPPKDPVGRSPAGPSAAKHLSDPFW